MPNQSKPKAWLDSNGRVVEKGDGGAQEKELDKFSIGALTGFEMALQDAFTALVDNRMEPKLLFRDIVTIECTGFQESQDSRRDDMIMFEVSISR